MNKTKTKRLAAAVTAFALAAACMTACGNSGSSDNSGSTADTTDAQTTAAESLPEAAEDGGDPNAEEENMENELKAPVNDGKIDVSAGATENMLVRSVLNRGDTSRLAEKLKAAKDLAARDDMEAFEKVEQSTKIAFLGDSITAGSSPSDKNNAYTSQLTEWWEENFSFYATWNNAGIGATDSYLGVHRVDQDVLADEPDIIFIEFINDVDNDFYKTAMDSLVRKCLAQPNNPAVILIEMTMEDGTCPQNVHSEIGLKYDIPIISYHDAVLPEVEAGNITWGEISPDNIHPNDAGHIMLAQMLENFIQSVADDLDNAGEPTAFDRDSVESPTGDKYRDATLADKNSELVKVTEQDGFEDQTQAWNFQDGWRDPDGGSITFEMEFQNLGMLYWMTVDGTSGTAAVTVDGVEISNINADFSGGWGDYAKGEEIVSFDEKGKHTVTVEVPEGKNFEILRWMIS